MFYTLYVLFVHGQLVLVLAAGRRHKIQIFGQPTTAYCSCYCPPSTPIVPGHIATMEVESGNVNLVRELCRRLWVGFKFCRGGTAGAASADGDGCVGDDGDICECRAMLTFGVW
jgi:hypothetical protein